MLVPTQSSSHSTHTLPMVRSRQRSPRAQPPPTPVQAAPASAPARLNSSNSSSRVHHGVPAGMQMVPATRALHGLRASRGPARAGMAARRTRGVGNSAAGAGTGVRVSASAAGAAAVAVAETAAGDTAAAAETGTGSGTETGTGRETGTQTGSGGSATESGGTGAAAAAEAAAGGARWVIAAAGTPKIARALRLRLPPSSSHTSSHKPARQCPAAAGRKNRQVQPMAQHLLVVQCCRLPQQPPTPKLVLPSSCRPRHGTRLPAPPSQWLALVRQLAATLVRGSRLLLGQKWSRSRGSRRAPPQRRASMSPSCHPAGHRLARAHHVAHRHVLLPRLRLWVSPQVCVAKQGVGGAGLPVPSSKDTFQQLLLHLQLASRPISHVIFARYDIVLVLSTKVLWVMHLFCTRCMCDFVRYPWFESVPWRIFIFTLHRHRPQDPASSGRLHSSLLCRCHAPDHTHPVAAWHVAVWQHDVLHCELL